jgi:hypothetical protein
LDESLVDDVAELVSLLVDEEDESVEELVALVALVAPLLPRWSVL